MNTVWSVWLVTMYFVLGWVVVSTTILMWDALDDRLRSLPAQAKKTVFLCSVVFWPIVMLLALPVLLAITIFHIIKFTLVQGYQVCVGFGQLFLMIKFRKRASSFSDSKEHKLPKARVVRS